MRAGGVVPPPGIYPALGRAHRPPWVWRESPGGLALVEEQTGRAVLQPGALGILRAPGPQGAWVHLTPEHPVARTLADSAAVAAAVGELLSVTGGVEDPAGLVSYLRPRWDTVRTEYMAQQLQRLHRLVGPADGRS